MEQNADTETSMTSAENKQKSENGLKIITAIACVTAVCGIGFGIYGMEQSTERNNCITVLETQVGKNDQYPKDFDIIQYSSGGGFGNAAYTSFKTVTINNDGKVTYTNNYDTDFIEYSSIEPEKYKSLTEYINNHMDVLLAEEKDRQDVLDADTSYITIKLKTGAEYKIGGYAAMLDDDFSQLASQIVDALGEEYDSYKDKVNSIRPDSIQEFTKKTVKLPSYIKSGGGELLKY